MYDYHISATTAAMEWLVTLNCGNNLTYEPKPASSNARSIRTPCSSFINRYTAGSHSTETLEISRAFIAISRARTGLREFLSYKIRYIFYIKPIEFAERVLRLKRQLQLLHGSHTVIQSSCA